MVRLFRFGVSCIVSLGFVSAAQALEGGYVKFSGGVTSPENYSTENEVLVDFGLGDSLDAAELDRDFGVGFMGSAALGFRPVDRLRLEFEAGYSRSEADVTVFTREGNSAETSRTSETDLTLVNGMVNGWFDVARFNSVSFFLGAGVGISYVDLNSVPAEPEAALPRVFLPDESDEATAFAWQAGGGLSVKVANNWALGAEYRYFDTARADIANSDFSARNHIGLVSISYLFGKSGFSNPDGDYRGREPVNESPGRF